MLDYYKLRFSVIWKLHYRRILLHTIILIAGLATFDKIYFTMWSGITGAILEIFSFGITLAFVIYSFRKLWYLLFKIEITHNSDTKNDAP